MNGSKFTTRYHLNQGGSAIEMSKWRLWSPRPFSPALTYTLVYVLATTQTGSGIIREQHSTPLGLWRHQSLPKIVRHFR